jgi:NAD(P)-dependent dehydrogenase (short-subunit alcohol dehydrogenase family)
MNLGEKVVVITGAKGGLGNFVTNAFLDSGAQVVGIARSIADSDFPNKRFTAVQAEITNRENAGALVQGVLARFSRADGLVHLVGGFAGGHSLAETDDSTFDKMVDMNMRSAFLMMRAVLPHMRAQGSGRILAIGSKAAVEPAPMAALYAATKAALVSLVRTVARENIDRNITANILLPGTMDTPANRAADPAADFSKWVQPTQVAELLVHLMSDASSQISGAVIPVLGAEA